MAERDETPASGPRRSRTLGDLACAIGCGLLLAACLPLVLPFVSKEEILPGGWLEPLALLGLAPLLVRLRRATPERALGLGVAAGAAHFLLMLYWLDVAMTTFGHMPRLLSIPVLLLLIAFLSLFWGVAFWAAVWVRDRLGLALAVVLPPIWVALEFLRNYVLTGFPWGNLGYTQVRTLWLAQLASLGGVYLVAFMVVWCNTLFEEVWACRRGRRPLPGRQLVAWAVAISLAAVYGGIRLGFFTDAQDAPRQVVGVIQGNLDEQVKLRGIAAQRWVLLRMLEQSRAAAGEGAKLVVWPEGSLPEPLPPAIRSLDSVLGSFFSLETELVIGGVTREERNGEVVLSNSAFLLDGKLLVQARYDKRHLVPFGEYVPLAAILPYQWFVPEGLAFFTPGPGHRPLKALVGDLGILICYEAIFPEIARETVAEGARLLVNITNDSWYGIGSAPYQHLLMSRMRAIETGRYLVRAANTGVSAIIDPLGRELGRLPLGLVPAGPAQATLEQLRPADRLVGTIALLDGNTPYLLLGDLFAWLCVAVTLAFLGIGFLRRRRQRCLPND